MIGSYKETIDFTVALVIRHGFARLSVRAGRPPSGPSLLVLVQLFFSGRRAFRRAIFRSAKFYAAFFLTISLPCASIMSFLRRYSMSSWKRTCIAWSLL